MNPSFPDESAFLETASTDPANQMALGSASEVNGLQANFGHIELEEERFRLLVEKTPAVNYTLITTASEESRAMEIGSIGYLSPRIEDLLGYPPRAFVCEAGLWASLIHPDDTECFLGRDIPPDEVTDLFTTEYRMRHRNGCYIWVRDDAVPIRDETGESVIWQCVLTDITRQREAEEKSSRLNEELASRVQERTTQLRHAMQEAEDNEELMRLSELRFRSLVQNSTDIVAILDEDLRFTYTSPSVQTLLGYTQGRLIDKPLFNLLHPEDINPFKQALRKIQHEELNFCRTEFRFLHDSGIWRYLDATLTNLEHEPGVQGIVFNARDVTENRAAAAKIAEREALLETLVCKLISAQEEERRRIAFDIHDGLAQTAYAAVQSLQTFISGYPPESGDEAEALTKILCTLRQNVREARRVVTELRPTVLDDLGLASALRNHLKMLSDEGFHVEYSENFADERLPPHIETALYRVAQEALNNSRKYAGTSQARVTLTREPDLARLKVSDRGKGFNPNAMLPSSDRERVGISSMTERVSMIGGTFDLTGSPGRGVRITVEVPLPVRVIESTGSRVYRVIVADDHDLMREGLVTLARSVDGIEVIGEASNGIQATELSRSLVPDMILMDIRMPGMSGLEATKCIKSENPEVSVLIVTTHDDPDYLLEAVRCGADGYLLKDATKTEFVRAVQRVMKGNNAPDQGLAMKLLSRLSGIADETISLHDTRDHSPLTEREIEVLEMISAGRTNREISALLFLSEGTVKASVRAIIRKLGVSDRTQAAVKALESGLITP